MKNPYFNVNLHFKFVDTSLCYAKFSMTKFTLKKGGFIKPALKACAPKPKPLKD